MIYVVGSSVELAATALPSNDRISDVIMDDSQQVLLLYLLPLTWLSRGPAPSPNCYAILHHSSSFLHYYLFFLSPCPVIISRVSPWIYHSTCIHECPTVDDASPSIVYEGVWIDTNSTDPLFVNYLNATFHVSQATVRAVAPQTASPDVRVIGSESDTHLQRHGRVPLRNQALQPRPVRGCDRWRDYITKRVRVAARVPDGPVRHERLAFRLAHDHAI